METLKLITESKFNDKKNKYYFVFGTKATTSNTKYYEVSLNFDDSVTEVCIASDNVGVKPQVGQFKHYYLIGNNNEFIIINLKTKEKKEYEIFPIFYQFNIIGDSIIIVGELGVICVNENELLWKQYFDEIIDFDYITDDYLYLVDYNSKRIKININTGKITSYE